MTHDAFGMLTGWPDWDPCRCGPVAQASDEGAANQGSGVSAIARVRQVAQTPCVATRRRRPHALKLVTETLDRFCPGMPYQFDVLEPGHQS